MANSDLVTGARREIFVGDIKENRPNSENVNRKLAGNINFLLERLVIKEKTVVNGYVNNGGEDDGVGGIIRIENVSIISTYDLAIRRSGNGGTTQFNYAVYNSAGGFVNNLFTTPPSMSGSNGTNVVVGREKLDTATPVAFATNNSGHSINNGTLALGTNVAPLLAGYILVPFIPTNASNAFNLTFNFKLKEL